MLNNDELINKGKQVIQANTISIIVVIVLLCIVLIIGITFGKYHPDPNSELIKDMIEQKVKEERTQYEEVLKIKDSALLDIQSQLNASSNLNLSYIKSINELNSQFKKIQKPKSTNETKKRLKELGYETK